MATGALADEPVAVHGTHPLLVRIGRNVKRLQEAQKITQAVLAERADLAVETISRLESGSVDISIVRLERLAIEGLGSSLAELIGSSPRIPRASAAPELQRLHGLWHGMEPTEVEYVYQGVKSFLTVREKRRDGTASARKKASAHK